MIYETAKIMNNIPVNSTCIRVPILRSHCESVSIRFNTQVDLNDILPTEILCLNCVLIGSGNVLFFLSPNEFGLSSSNTYNLLLGCLLA